MYDPHEQDTLELPDINRHNIEDNKYAILQNRIMIAGSCALAIAMVVGSHIILKHDVEDCQETLYKHITGNEIHKNLFEEE